MTALHDTMQVAAVEQELLTMDCQVQDQETAETAEVEELVTALLLAVSVVLVEFHTEQITQTQLAVTAEQTLAEAEVHQVGGKLQQEAVAQELQ